MLETELATINTEIERYVTAIGASMMSPALRMKLEEAELAKARIAAKLEQTPAADQHIGDMVPALVDRVHEIVGGLRGTSLRCRRPSGCPSADRP